MTVPYQDTSELRQAVIDACLSLNNLGINQGTSGNISVRVEDQMLITPSGIAYDCLSPDMLVSMPLDGRATTLGQLKPSTEWRFHQSILLSKPHMHAVVHAHPVYCTALAMNHQEIPACHYMVAAFGGNSVPLADYAIFGSEALSNNLDKALADRHGCLMANHGAVVTGETLEKAMWRMVELETLAKGYVTSLSIGHPQLLSDPEIEEVLRAFSNYGAQNK
ncbi:class II aldolase [Parasedimentitalea marina]|uniref:Class II aldolase n=1 Tax=Parasedimentitalea marina TaxID=2483033 RepID=A0A3T0N2U8_9RHOB|nr:class II aldolase/adducin family protein [Parasedimentitalea marina]AZV78319.1 class II aldolase [Parasedimentitalea marina]